MIEIVAPGLIPDIYKEVTGLYRELGAYASTLEVQQDGHFIDVTRTLRRDQLEFPTDPADDLFTYSLECSIKGLSDMTAHQIVNVDGAPILLDNNAHAKFDARGDYVMGPCGPNLLMHSLMTASETLDGCTPNTDENARDMNWNAIRGDEAAEFNALFEGLHAEAGIDPRTLDHGVLGRPIGKIEGSELESVRILQSPYADLRVPGNEVASIAILNGINDGIMVLNHATYGRDGNVVEQTVNFLNGDNTKAYLTPEQRTVAKTALGAQMTGSNLMFNNRRS